VNLFRAQRSQRKRQPGRLQKSRDVAFPHGIPPVACERRLADGPTIDAQFAISDGPSEFRVGGKINDRRAFPRGSNRSQFSRHISAERGITIEAF